MASHFPKQGFEYVVGICDSYSLCIDHDDLGSYATIEEATTVADTAQKNAEHYISYTVFDKEGKEVYCARK